MRKNTFMLSVFNFMMCISVSADVTGLEIAGGSVKIAKPNGQIQMVDEVIDMTFADTKYDVDVSYTFKNYGDEVRLTVGFPQWTVGYENGKDVHFRNFKFYQNSAPIPYTVVKIDEDYP